MSTCGSYFNMLGLVWALKVLKTSNECRKNGKELRNTRKEMYMLGLPNLAKFIFHSN